MEQKHNEAVDWSLLKEKWPSAFVARTKISEFSGGMICAGTLANEDSKGTGPEGGFVMNGRKMYQVDPLITWLQQRAARPMQRKVRRKKV
jgi:hypothetical protein